MAGSSILAMIRSVLFSRSTALTFRWCQHLGEQNAQRCPLSQMWCLRLDPKLTAYNQGNGCRAQTIWMYAKGVRVEREDQYMVMNFPMIFPFQKHSSGCSIHPILRGLQSWPKMRCGWRSGNQSHWHQFQAKHKDSGTSITKFMQEQAIGTKPDRDKERQFLCNAVLGSQDASNAKRSTCHRLILSRTDMNDWTDSWVRSVELNGSFFGSRHFPVLRNHATGGDRSSGVLLPKHLPGAWLDQSHGVERRLRYSTWKRAGMIHWHQRLRLWGILSASLMAFLSFLHGLTSIWKVRALPSTPSRSYLREIAVPS